MASQLKKSKTKPNTYTFVTVMGYHPDGRVKQKIHTLHGNKKECESQRNRIIQEIDQGTFADTGKLSIQQFLEEWLAKSAKSRVTTRTLEEYELELGRYVYPRLGSLLLSKLQAQHLDKLYSDLVTSGRHGGQGGLSPNTVLRVHRVLHRAFKVAVRWRYIAVNPCDATEPPSRTYSEITALSMAEVAALLEKAQGCTVYIPIVIAVHTGMRLGEILALRWSDVDLDDQLITVRQSISDTRRSGLQFKTPKSKKVRVVTLPDLLIPILTVHRLDQAKRRGVLGNTYQDYDLVFPNDNGTPRAPGDFSSTFSAFVRRSGLRRCRFHDLRHTHATMLLRAKVAPKVASDRLGHSTIQITQDLYSHVQIDMQREAAQRIDQLFQDGS